MSEFSRKSIIEWTGISAENVVNVGNGVDEVFNPVGPIHQPGYPYILHIGNHKPHKNMIRLLEAFSRSGLSSELKLILSGEPDWETVSHIDRFRLNDSVNFTGFIPEEELPNYYRGSLALVFPSLYEGFGLPILEAMACGTPVITSDVSGMPEAAGNAALLINPLDTDDIACAIQKVIHDSSLRSSMREKGFLQARKFSWDVTAAKVQEVLLGAMEKY